MLENFFHELNQIHFNGTLPLPELEWNSRLSSTAGRFCPGSRNPLRPRRPKIEIASYLQSLKEGSLHIRDTVLHEMIHYYLWHQGRPCGHTEEFHAIMKKVGAKRWNPVPKDRPIKHWYECPQCKTAFPARRKLGASACASCCKKYNAGNFHERFLLQRKSTPPQPVNSPSMIDSPRPAREEPKLSPQEIIHRLENLKNLIRTSSGNIPPVR